jgi:NAD(P)-dependent dehydrogenase (short-subunit alcohol dehydrogenase family)
MLTMVVCYLAALIPVSHTGVVINLVCPGLCKTEITRNVLANIRKDIAHQLEQFRRMVEDGSRTLIYTAVAGRESHGCFLQSCEDGE